MFADQIIRARRKAAQLWEEPSPEEAALEEGYVIVKYEKLELEEKLLLHGAVSMQLPKFIQPMEDELMRIKYPNPDRPDCIYSDEDGAVTLTMELEEGAVAAGELVL